MLHPGADIPTVSDQGLTFQVVLASRVDYRWIMMTLAIHSQIEVGTITGTLHFLGEELICLVGDCLLRAHLDGDRFVFSGGSQGEHSLDARASITSAVRLVAHWRGYVENNTCSHLQVGGSL
jgi:hypothetical protein